MKKLIPLIALLLVLGPMVSAHGFDTDLYVLTNADVPPNILIIFDNSGSMNDPITAELYDRTKTYPFTFTDSPNAVFYDTTGGLWNLYRSDVSLINCADVKTALINEGFYIGKIKFDSSDCAKSSQVNLMLGNYLNYLQAGGGSSNQPRLGLAKGAIQSYVNTTEGVRFGVMIFNDNTPDGQETEGGHIVLPVRDMTPANRSDLHNAIGGLHAYTWTPLAETLYEAGLYFKGAASRFNPGVQYESPIQTYCQKNYVILITDGQPTKDRNSVLTEVGDTDEDGREPGGVNEVHYDTDGTDYLDDVAKKLHETDMFPDTMKGDQNVTTYTIGFTIDTPLLRRTAHHGGGRYFYCHNAQSFLMALRSIINDILAKSTSFVAPVVPISQMEKTSAGDRMYLAMFKPTAKSFWKGNIKKFGIATTNNGDIKVGMILDANGDLALDKDGQIKNDLSGDKAKSYWSSAPDGDDVEAGGVGEKLRNRSASRNIYTYMGSSPNLTDSSNAFTLANSAITPSTLNLSINDTLGREKIINFIHGLDSYDENGNGNLAEKRDWILGAFIHSRPFIVHYGSGRSVIYAGANDGMVHAFDDATGEELWAFIPPNLLPKLNNLQGNTLEFFVDGAPKVYVNPDTNQVILIIGQRRGGDRYHALDVSDPLAPKLFWEISPLKEGFGELGQTWSTPQLGKVVIDSTEKMVMFIGGGYDTNQDNLPMTKADERGRAVYVVDLLTGSLIWSYSFAKDASMTYCVASDVARVDTNGDGKVDRLYAGSLGGRVWKFDLSDSSPANWTAKMLFTANPGGSEQRKIFYPPDVTLERDNVGNYEMVFFGTGDREHPKDITVVNRIYAVKDKNPSALLTETDLVDVTHDQLQDPNTTAADKEALLNALIAKSGWYIKLDVNPGEKVLAPPVVFFKKAYFSTFAPSNQADQSQPDPCFIGQGKGRLYILDYMNGNAAYNLDLTNDIGGEVVQRSDRTGVIGSAIPSGVIITFIGGQAVGYVGVGGGVFAPKLPTPKSLIPVNWRLVF